MGLNKSQRSGILAVTVYLALVILAFTFFVFNAGASALASIFIMALTFPWSYIETIIWLILSVVDEIPFVVKAVTLVFYSILNGGLLYCLITKEKRLRYGRGERGA